MPIKFWQTKQKSRKKLFSFAIAVHPLLICPFPSSSACDSGSYFPENKVCKCANYLHTAQFSLRHSTRVFAKHTSIQFSSSVLFSNSKQKKQGYPLPLSQLKSLKYVEQQLILHAPLSNNWHFFLHTMSCMLRIIILGLEFSITHLYFSKGIQTIKRLSSNFWTPNTGVSHQYCPNIISFPSHWPWIDGTPCIWKKNVNWNSIL